MNLFNTNISNLYVSSFKPIYLSLFQSIYLSIYLSIFLKVTYNLSSLHFLYSRQLGKMSNFSVSWGLLAVSKVSYYLFVVLTLRFYQKVLSTYCIISGFTLRFYFHKSG